MSGLDVPNWIKDFLWLAASVYAESLFSVLFFFLGNNVMKGFLSWCFFSVKIVHVLICHTDHVPILYVIITVCVMRKISKYLQ